jgi:hypothetical protein
MTITAALLNGLKNSVDTALSVVTDLVHHVHKRTVSEFVTIAAGANKEYDLQTLLGTKHAVFDKDAAQVTVRIKDVVPASSTLNMYINSETTVVHAVRANRYIRVVNISDVSIDVHVRIDVPRLP